MTDANVEGLKMLDARPGRDPGFELSAGRDSNIAIAR